MMEFGRPKKVPSVQEDGVALQEEQPQLNQLVGGTRVYRVDLCGDDPFGGKTFLPSEEVWVRLNEVCSMVEDQGGRVLQLVEIMVDEGKGFGTGGAEGTAHFVIVRKE